MEVERKLDPKSGKMVEYTYRNVEVKVPRAVLERRAVLSRNKFGLGKDDDRGATRISDEPVWIELTKRTKRQTEEEELASVALSAREIKNETWTSRVSRLAKDSWADVINTSGGEAARDSGAASPSPSGPASAASAALGGPSKYIPPSLRAAMEGGGGGGGGGREFDRERERDQEPSLRVTNLPEDTTEEEIRALFSEFGPILRVYRARDRRNRSFLNYAFVVFREREDGDLAIQKMNGYGFQHLILQVEWAKPRNFSYLGGSNQ